MEEITKLFNVARYRNTPYVVHYHVSSGNVKTYQWTGSTKTKKDIKQVPQEVINYLVMTSQTFRDGELAIIDDSEEAKEVLDEIDDKESYKNNTNTREDIEKILKGNANSLKSKLKSITADAEKRFILDVAKEIDIDSSASRKALSEWSGIPEDDLFAKDEA
ncbi:hypothetical protein EEL31_10440 [Brevibacillus laterosporus]|nr:hypothetical protein [Brevibacillus laterosporus]TPG68907.1 hypothetical protein EEL31_10440 [Brevibacillus laterosporus]